MIFGKEYIISESPVLLSDGSVASEFSLSEKGKILHHHTSARGTTTGIHEHLERHRLISNSELKEISKLFSSKNNVAILNSALQGYSSAISLPISSLYYKLYNKPQSNIRIQTQYTVISNMIGGSGHHGFGPGFTEIMIIINPPSSENALSLLSYIYDTLRKELVSKYGVESVMNGPEGAFAPSITNNEALLMLQEVLEEINNPDIGIAIDVAATSFAQKYNDKFVYNLEGVALNTNQLFDYYKIMLRDFPLLQYVEDPFDPEDFEGWRLLSQYMRKSYPSKLLVGDDLTATSAEKIDTFTGIINAVICKPNQAGTILNFSNAVRLAREKGLYVIASQRSVEDDSDFLIDLGINFGCNAFKLGAPARERIVKYNSLMRKTGFFIENKGVKEAINFLDVTLSAYGYEFIVRGSSSYGASFIESWSDIDSSVLVNKISVKDLENIRKVLREYKANFSGIKLSLTPFDMQDNPAANPFHHHGIKPFAYTLELCKQFSNEIFNIDHTKFKTLTSLQANSLYRYYEIYYKIISDFVNDKNEDQTIAEAWHRVSRQVRTCLEILHTDLLEEHMKINENKYFVLLPFREKARLALQNYQEIRTGWSSMTREDRIASQAKAVAIVINIHETFINVLNKGRYND